MPFRLLRFASWSDYLIEGMSLAGVAAASAEHPPERRYVSADCWNCLRALRRLWRYRPSERRAA